MDDPLVYREAKGDRSISLKDSKRLKLSKAFSAAVTVLYRRRNIFHLRMRCLDYRIIYIRMLIRIRCF